MIRRLKLLVLHVHNTLRWAGWAGVSAVLAYAAWWWPRQSEPAKPQLRHGPALPPGFSIIVFEAGCDSADVARFLAALRETWPTAVVDREHFANGWKMPLSRIYYRGTGNEWPARQIESWLSGAQEVVDVNLQQEHPLPERPADPQHPVANIQFGEQRNLAIFAGADLRDILTGLRLPPGE